MSLKIENSRRVATESRPVCMDLNIGKHIYCKKLKLGKPVVTRCVGYGYLIEKKYIGDLPESSLHAMA
jgi:hypothetical protein